MRINHRIRINHAKANNKPIFCFLVDEEYPWPPKMVEDEPGKSKLRSFKAKIESICVKERFTSPEDLAYKIATSMGRYLSSFGNSGQTKIPVMEKEFLKIIFDEIIALRRVVENQSDLRQKVQHIENLLQLSDTNTATSTKTNATLHLDFEGCWRDSKTGTTLYARFIDGELFVPYCYRGNSELTGVFFDFRRKSDDVFFGRFKWLNSSIHGFAYIERSGSSGATGGWWYSENVPKDVLENLEKLHPNLPLMNFLNLFKVVQPELMPKWAEQIFSMQKSELLKLLTIDSQTIDISE